MNPGLQGHLFFYYLPQTLGNNISPLGKNSSFGKKLKARKKKRKFKGNEKKKKVKKSKKDKNLNKQINENKMKNKKIKIFRKDLWVFLHFWGKNPSLHIDGKGELCIFAFWVKQG